MLKTTVYFFTKLSRKLLALARRRQPQRPKFPLFNSGKPHLFDAPDEELLKGFRRPVIVVNACLPANA